MRHTVGCDVGAGQRHRWLCGGRRTHNPLIMLSISRADQRPCTRSVSKLRALPVRAGARGGWTPMLYSTRVQQRVCIQAHHGVPLRTTKRTFCSDTVSTGCAVRERKYVADARTGHADRGAAWIRLGRACARTVHLAAEGVPTVIAPVRSGSAGQDLPSHSSGPLCAEAGDGDGIGGLPRIGTIVAVSDPAGSPPLLLSSPLAGRPF